MKILISTAVLCLLAAPIAAQAQGQTQDAPPASPQTPSATDLTRALNGGPPFVAPTPAPTPNPTPAPTATAAPVPATLSTPAPTVTRPAPTPTPTATPTPTRPAGPAPDARPSAAASVAPANPTPAPAATAAPVPATLSSPAPTPTAAPPAPAAPAPAYRLLDAAAQARLPFRLDLPEGFDIVSGRPGPDFTVYSVRHEGTPFVMIYAGPASQFPIYDGQIAEVAGRATVVVTEADGRHAMEHLFQRATAPREIHVWVASLDGADRATAERIAQTVDLR